MNRAIAFVAAAVLSTAGIAAGKSVPDRIRHYETIAATEMTSASDAVSRLSFRAFGRPFELAVEPNGELFRPGARNIWIDAAGRRVSEEPAPVFYKGTVESSEGSWVRVALIDGALDGMFYTKDEVYFLEPAARHLGPDHADESIIYRLSDTVVEWEPGSCALDDPAVAAGMVVHAPRFDFDAIRSMLPSSPASTLKQCQIGIVADYEYYLDHGGASATDMQSIMNQIDGIYRSEVNVAFAISQTVVYTTSADPFSSTTSPNSLLDEFSAYRSSSSSPVHGLDLAHLFTNRELDGSVIGIAWLSSLCSGYYGAGLSQDYTTNNTSLVILTAHELGHNFGAYHDNQSGSPCASTPFGYIMNPYVSTSLALQFSTCSKTYMNAEISSSSCLSTISTGNNPPVADAGTDQTVDPSESVSLDGTGSYDIDGNPITYSWTQISGAPVTLADPATATPSFTAPAFDGILGFSLTVSDGSLTDDDTVYVTVQSGPAGTPVITSIKSRRAERGGSASIRGSGFSNDTRLIRVSFDGLSARIRSASATRIRVRIPTGARRRAYVPVFVTVGGAASNTVSFYVK